MVERGLSHYPALHRKISETIDKVAADYHAATDEQPLPPAWSEVLDKLHSLPSQGDPAVVKVMDNIRSIIDNAHQQTLKAYQKNCAERHKILSGMQPQWRSLHQDLQSTQKTISGLEEHSKTIDRQMERYESMRKGEDKATNTLLASSFTQFVIASIVLVIAAFGGIINFHLIALPMSEMVGGSAYIGTVRMSDIAALVIIMVEIAMGLFVMECLRITHLFPVIGRLDDRIRKRMLWVALTILVIFATIESSLAYMRDLLAQDREALSQALVGGATAAEAQFRWIPSIGQMVLGFILPFALAFVAIPLESFIHSSRAVLGTLVVGLLRALRVVLRAVGGFSRQLSRMLISLYDIFIMLPLAIEQRLSGVAERRREQRAEKAQGAEAEEGKAAPAQKEKADGGSDKPARRSPLARRRKTNDDNEQSPQEPEVPHEPHTA